MTISMLTPAERKQSIQTLFLHNFIRIHQTIRCTPAMEAGVTDQLWEMSDLVALIESRECEAARSAEAGA